MKFYTNKISTNKTGSFSELIKTALGNEQQVKTASSEAKLSKTAQEAGINDDGEGKREGKHWIEGSPSDDNGEPEADGEVKTVEPAGLDSGKETMSEAEGETKLASDEGDSGPAKGDGPGDDDDLEGKNEGRFPEPDRESSDCYTQEAEDDGKAEVKASAKKQKKEAGELPDALKEHQFKSKDSKDDDDGHDDADGKEDDADKEACNASAKVSSLEKIANLSPKAKARLKSYWNMVYPEAYADAMTQDK
tara:strand:- start:65622 stop:66368 length:747 start_codon:yes stop_codon:yes gene_type:complete